MTTRRSFLQTSAAAAAAWTLYADPLGLPIGTQSYPVREQLSKDFTGTLKQISGLGYRMIEMCSPPGYEKAGFGSLVGLKASELRAKIHDAGLGCESCHYGFKELKDNLDDRIAFARDLGLKQMIVATVGVPAQAPFADWNRAADDLNKIGEKTKSAGLQTGFHNHHFEFQKIDGVLIYDELMRRLDPNLVKMQFQVSVINLGYDAAEYFAKYPGRFISIHLQDWDPSAKKQVAVGKGTVDWPRLFAAARKAGVKNYFVELPMEQMQDSYAYLHNLKV